MPPTLPSNFQTLGNATVDSPQFTTGSLGVGIPLVGANCPAGLLTAPYTWVRILAADGTPCVFAAYKL